MDKKRMNKNKLVQGYSVIGFLVMRVWNLQQYGLVKYGLQYQSWRISKEKKPLVWKNRSNVWKVGASQLAVNKEVKDRFVNGEVVANDMNCFNQLVKTRIMALRAAAS